MASKYDVENLLTDIKAILVANLNTQIAAVEAEKIAQGLPNTGLLPVDTGKAYFEQNWSDEIMNYSPAIFFGVEDITAIGGSNGVPGATLQKIQVFVEIIMVDSGMDVYGKNRIHRYARAIRDVLQDNARKLPSSGSIIIETVRPISFKLDLNSSDFVKVGGVSLTTVIG